MSQPPSACPAPPHPRRPLPHGPSAQEGAEGGAEVPAAVPAPPHGHPPGSGRALTVHGRGPGSPGAGPGSQLGPRRALQQSHSPEAEMRRARPPPRHCRELAAPARCVPPPPLRAGGRRAPGSERLRDAGAGRVRAAPGTEGFWSAGRWRGGRVRLAPRSAPRLEGGPGDYSQCF